MTTADTAGRVRTPMAEAYLRFPALPKIPEDKMTSSNQLTLNGTAHHIVQHLATP